MKAILAGSVLLALLVSSCASEPDNMLPPAEADPKAEPIRESNTPKSADIPADPSPPPVEESTLPPQGEDEGLSVTEEVYEQTFREIELLITALNTVISKRQYSRWTNYLSTTYRKTYNDPSALNQINQYPQLKDKGIVLRNLKDYFDWVVVPSRSRAVLDEIVFAGESRVIAYSSYDGKRAKLYELERIGGKWKITVW